MIEWFKQRMPQPESLARNRWLRWLGPALYHPHLWRFSRRGLALGIAIGVFFGFLIPIAQMPFSAAAAVVLRANLPAAMVSTLVTNPVTFAPVYYAAYQTGAWLLAVEPEEAAGNPPSSPQSSPSKNNESETSDLLKLWTYVSGVGKPLVLGLSLFAVAGFVLVYVAVNWFWIWRVRRRWKLRKRAARLPHTPR
jgi:uncharacterized protein (DUF2062 family)